MPLLKPWITELPDISESLVQFLESAPLPGLFSEGRAPTLAKQLSILLQQQKIGPKPESGLWLAIGELDRSHSISQEIADDDGSFWHGIMHRREGDFWNSKYWFRRIGNHPVVDALPADLRGDPKIGKSSLDKLLDKDAFSPSRMVDLCEFAKRENEALFQEELRWVAWIEWQRLFAHCWQPA